MKEKLEHKVAKSTAMVTVALFLSFFPVIVGVMVQGLFQVFRQRLAMCHNGHIFGHLNSVTNPLVYFYRGSLFQEGRVGDFED